MSLADLFPDGDYRFHLTLRRSTPEEFFRPTDPTGAVLAERRRWLAADPDRYLAVAPDGAAVVSAFAALAHTWNVATDDVAAETLMPTARDAVAQLRGLSGRLEPDLLLLQRDRDGEFRLCAGALCFPTGWALTEKLGQPLGAIHGVVPGLNPAIGGAIQQFLAKLKPGVAFLRDNWGIAASSELNLHPSREIPAPQLPVALHQLWLRVEHQALLALPETAGIAFGIRIALHRLDRIQASPEAPALHRALASMPSELIAYKRLDRIRDHLLNVL
jgi:dimethylamine monooxygenase subunit A